MKNSANKDFAKYLGTNDSYSGYEANEAQINFIPEPEKYERLEASSFLKESTITRSESATTLSLNSTKNRQRNVPVCNLSKPSNQDRHKLRDMSEKINHKMASKKNSASKTNLEINAYTEHGDYANKLPQTSSSNQRFELLRNISKSKLSNISKQELPQLNPNFNSVHVSKNKEDNTKWNSKRTDSRKPLNFRNIDRQVNQSINTSTIRINKLSNKATTKNK